MQPGTWLAGLANAVSPTSRRCLAGCGRPLAVLAVLVIGATLFTGAAALLGTRQPVAVFHAAAEGASAGPTRADLHALPVHQPLRPAPAPAAAASGQPAAVLDEALAGLKRGPFGVAFAPAAVATLAADGDPGAPAAPLPRVLVDATSPPLRIDIMGFEQLPLLPGPAATVALP